MLNEEEEVPKNPSQEKRGQGVNGTVFWVTHNLMNDWIQLPDAQPEHIQCARLVVKMMTGHLNSAVNSCPPFPGKERHFLRAQLARLQHTTEICPKGLYEIDEETNEQKFAEEFAIPSTDELKSMEAWCHVQPILLKAGRCTHAEPVGMSEEEKEEYMGKLAEEDKTEERFRALVEDNQIEGSDAWSSKICGDNQNYNKVGGEGTTTYAVNVIRSQRWPGALTVAKNGKYCSIYIGDGCKRGDTCFNPTEPPEV